MRNSFSNQRRWQLRADKTCGSSFGARLGSITVVILRKFPEKKVLGDEDNVPSQIEGEFRSHYHMYHVRDLSF
jgi:hypothetical protein